MDWDITPTAQAPPLFARRVQLAPTLLVLGWRFALLVVGVPTSLASAQATVSLAGWERTPISQAPRQLASHVELAHLPLWQDLHCAPCVPLARTTMALMRPTAPLVSWARILVLLRLFAVCALLAPTLRWLLLCCALLVGLVPTSLALARATAPLVGWARIPPVLHLLAVCVRLAPTSLALEPNLLPPVQPAAQAPTALEPELQLWPTAPLAIWARIPLVQPLFAACAVLEPTPLPQGLLCAPPAALAPTVLALGPPRQPIAPLAVWARILQVLQPLFAVRVALVPTLLARGQLCASPAALAPTVLALGLLLWPVAFCVEQGRTLLALGRAAAFLVLRASTLLLLEQLRLCVPCVLLVPTLLEKGLHSAMPVLLARTPLALEPLSQAAAFLAMWASTLLWLQLLAGGVLVVPTLLEQGLHSALCVLQAHTVQALDLLQPASALCAPLEHT